MLDRDLGYQRALENVRWAKAEIDNNPDLMDGYMNAGTAVSWAERYKGILALLHSSEPSVQTAGKIPEAEIVFLDEAFKCNDGVLNSLLTALNEHKYTPTRDVHIPSPPSPSLRRPTRFQISMTRRKRFWRRCTTVWN
ncbi:MAG: AAA family ATPase [Oscillospiraceae bacterium]